MPRTSLLNATEAISSFSKSQRRHEQVERPPFCCHTSGTTACVSHARKCSRSARTFFGICHNDMNTSACWPTHIGPLLHPAAARPCGSLLRAPLAACSANDLSFAGSVSPTEARATIVPAGFLRARQGSAGASFLSSRQACSKAESINLRVSELKYLGISLRGMTLSSVKSGTSHAPSNRFVFLSEL
jgi:hypothetical protein